jgi:hypothetical protein
LGDRLVLSAPVVGSSPRRVWDEATQEFGGGEDSDETLPPAEELGYQFKATDGVSSHEVNTFRTQELYQHEVFQHSPRTYHPGLSASVEMRMAWSVYDLQRER